MQAILRFSRAVDWITDLFAEFASWLVLLACLVSAGNALIRYALSVSSNGWLEVQWYMFGGIVLLGASQTLRLNEHVRVDLVYASVSSRARLWIDVIGIILFLIPVTLFLVWLCAPFFWTSFIGNEMSSNAGGLVRWPVKLVLPLGFLMLALQGVSELIKRIAALKGLLLLDTKYEKPLQ